MALDERVKEDNGNGKAKPSKLFSDSAFNVMLTNKKLVCRVWSDDGTKSTPKRLAKVSVKYGAPFFEAKIGGKKRLFKINYETKGLIKQDGKQLIYDTHFSNTVGGMSFYQFPESMDSDEAYTVFKDNAVNMYVKKGGIPLLYLLFAMGAVIAMAIAIVATVPAGFRAQDDVKDLDEQVTSLKSQISSLQSENSQLRTQINNNNALNNNNNIPNSSNNNGNEGFLNE